MSDKDLDAQFADIVAHWDDVPAQPEQEPRPTAAEPGAEDGGTAPGAAAEQEGTARPTPPPASPPRDSPPPASRPGPLPGGFRFEGGPSLPPEDAVPVEPPPSWRSPEPVEEPEEEHFQPGPTAPLPAGDLQFWGILAGLVGGPLLLLYLVLFHREGNPLWMLLAVGITVGGFGLLVQRLPRHRDDDDDGAVL
jgi:hypothetical protein